MEEKKIETLLKSEQIADRRLGQKICHARRIPYYIRYIISKDASIGYRRNRVEYSLFPMGKVYAIYMRGVYYVNLKRKNGTIKTEQ